MISVCIATYNGGKYIREQLESILHQLRKNDEVIVSDDSSTDNTLAIVASFNDNRVKIFPNNEFHSPALNFEHAIKMAKGDYIFLCDQDDVWKSDKVALMLQYLKKYTLVVSDCTIIDKDGALIRDSLWNNKIPRKDVFSNLIKNHYMGCCMAFRRELLKVALPFPSKIPMHDIWLGLNAACFYSTLFIPEKLLHYRRHGDNASPTTDNSTLSWNYRISYRIYLILQLLRRKYSLKLRSISANS